MLRSWVAFSIIFGTTTSAWATENAPTIVAPQRWDLFAGGIGGHQLRMDVFPASGVDILIGYTKSIGDAVAIGLTLTNAQQYELFNTNQYTGTGGVIATVPIRIKIINERLTAGLRINPGIGWVNSIIASAERGWQLTLGVSAHVGYWIVEGRWMLGGGIDGMVGTNTQRFLPYGPVLLGVITQVQIIDWIAMYAEFKAGPTFTPIGNPFMTLSRRFLIGVAFNFGQ